MAAQKGRSILLKIDDGTGSPTTFTTVGGVRTRTMTINNEAVDITNSDTAPWMQLLSGAGIKSLAFSGSGFFNGDTAINQLELAAFNADSQQIECQLVFPNGAIWQGLFHMATFEYGGEHNGAQTFNISLESADQILYFAP